MYTKAGQIIGTLESVVDTTLTFTGNLQQSLSDQDELYREANCPEGHWCDFAASVKTECPPGKFSEGGANACALCGEGQYQESARQDHCDVCPAGSSCAADESTGLRIEAVACAPGRYSLESHTDDTCIECDEGQYQDSQEGEWDCIECPAGSICARGAVAATPCEQLGSYCPQGSAEEEDCPLGYYCAS